MKIEKIQVLRGPNIWSNYRKNLIQMRLDLEEMEKYPTDKIPGFRERIEKLLPTMVKHECSEMKYGGFFIRVERGTWMGHVIEHIALEIQTLAGMFTGYGRTRGTKTKGIYNVVFAYQDEEAGIYAAKAAVRIAEALIAATDYDLNADINELKAICERNCLSKPIQDIIEAAKKKNIPFLTGRNNDMQFGYGKFQKHLDPEFIHPGITAKQAVESIFPSNTQSRIPIIAVTGTNGKTTTTRLLSHIVMQQGYITGYTTTDGIYINNVMQERGDTTGPDSARVILRDPSVEFAVLETARGGILRAGLGFDKCDVGVITNIKEDHLGINDIHTLKDLAKVKGVVVNSVKKEGWAVLNADDEQCLKIAEELSCNIAFFSMDSNNIHVAKALQDNSTVAFYKDGYIIIQQGDTTYQVAHVQDVPLTMQGKLKFMVANALAASLAAFVTGFSAEHINSSLQSFVPGHDTTPGRMNVFNFSRFSIVVDYAHNPHGFMAIEDFLKNVQVPCKIGIISGVGDRRDEDIVECGKIAGRMFDHIIIRSKINLRGRVQENVTALLEQGIASAGRTVTHDYVAEELEAVKHAMSIASDGDLIISLTDEVPEVIAYIQQCQELDSIEEIKGQSA
jgi:UDP-N-acetylmuramyl tripeptide synthase